MTSQPTVGIIGLGYGRAHIPAFQAHGCPVVAVSQRDGAAARTIAEKYGIPQVYTRWGDVIDRARPDIVVIATPVHLHRAIALRAFAAGAHVLCEKPLALHAAEGREMVEAAARARRVAMTGFNWRFTAAMQALNRLVREEDVVGRLFHVRAAWMGGRWAVEDATATWRMDRAQAGFGAMGDMGVHLVDLIRWNFGEFARVTAHAGIAYASRTAPGAEGAADAEDYCTVMGELAAGAQVTLTVSRVAHGRTEHTLEAYGKNGAVSYRFDRATGWLAELQVSRGGKPFERVETPGPPPTPEGDPLEQIGRVTVAPLVGRMLHAIRTGEPATPSLEDGLRAQVVLDAARVAADQWAELSTSPAPR